MAKNTESMETFLDHKFPGVTIRPAGISGDFNVFRIADQIQTGSVSPPYIRREFHKIMLYQGTNVFHYPDKSIPVKGKTLLFFNPLVPYAYDPPGPDTTGYFCVFREELFNNGVQTRLSDLPLFGAGARPVFALSDRQYAEMTEIFEKILEDMHTDYRYKADLVRARLEEIIYSALKLEPSASPAPTIGASHRITAVFAELLERQFPVESMGQRFELRSPQAFAKKLFVHVNHLNRAIKKTTGRTTSEYIFERLIIEARTLLKHTDWTIAEISYALGFDDQSRFNHFFRKRTGNTPSAFRQV